MYLASDELIWAVNLSFAVANHRCFTGGDKKSQLWHDLNTKELFNFLLLLFVMVYDYEFFSLAPVEAASGFCILRDADIHIIFYNFFFSSCPYLQQGNICIWMVFCLYFTVWTLVCCRVDLFSNIQHQIHFKKICIFSWAVISFSYICALKEIVNVHTVLFRCKFGHF